MPKFDHHFFVCTNSRPPIANPSCGAQQAHELYAVFQEAIEKFGWQARVAVNATSCLGPCEHGPIVVVYPSGVWYAHVQPGEVEAILRSHVLEGRAAERQVLEDEDRGLKIEGRGSRIEDR